MKLKPLFFIALGLGLFLTMTAQGRFGWTLEQCIAKYGLETQQFTTQAHGLGDDHFFQVGDSTLRVTIRKNLAVDIMYAKFSGEPFSIAEIALLKDKNKPDNTRWDKDKCDNKGRLFCVATSLKDGSHLLMVNYGFGNKTLGICTWSQVRLIIESSRLSAEEKLRGL